MSTDRIGQGVLMSFGAARSLATTGSRPGVARGRRRRRATVASGVVVALVALTVGCSGSAGGGAGSDGAGPAVGRTTTTRPPLRPLSVAAPAGAEVTQPEQPVTGPGSSDLPHRDWRVSSGGTGPDAWYVFEPASPRPRSAPVAIVVHGYYEFSGYEKLHELIRHTVLGGSVVVYPMWQTGAAVPCPGPFDVEPCMRSALAGIRGALAHLAADPGRVQPDLDRASYFGFSFGGILTANLTNRWRQLDLPEPSTIVLDDPHDSGLAGLGEPALDDSLEGIPSTVLVACHVGAEGVIAEDPTGGCNAVLPKLAHVPSAHRAIVATRPDRHGQPALSSGHGVCTAQRGEADAYDWNVCWRLWDALRAAAEPDGPDSSLDDALGARSTGTWSDGTPIAPLLVQRSAPIRP